MALLETKEFLTSNVSMMQYKWEWGMMHYNHYVNLPWSRTPLKFIFDKRVSVPGNDHTPNVSKMPIWKNKDSAVLVSTASANYKMLL